MNKQDRELLLKDLCARLPYHTIVKYRNANVDLTQYIKSVKLTECKPYLRPVSSMTEEEESKYNLIQGLQHWTVNDGKIQNYGDAIDWLNEHYFDYRGLIKKGLALEAPEGMYNN